MSWAHCGHFSLSLFLSSLFIWKKWHILALEMKKRPPNTWLFHEYICKASVLSSLWPLLLLSSFFFVHKEKNMYKPALEKWKKNPNSWLFHECICIASVLSSLWPLLLSFSFIKKKNIYKLAQEIKNPRNIWLFQEIHIWRSPWALYGPLHSATKPSRVPVPAFNITERLKHI